MKRKEILKVLSCLSKSNGFYSRLYNELLKNNDNSNKIIEDFEKQNFKDAVDLVLYIEC